MLRTLKARLQRCELALGDAILGIKTISTCAAVPPANTMYGDAIRFESKNYSLIWQYLRPVKLHSDDVFYDIGCGTGRVLCVAARLPLRKCIGVELSRPLCEKARANAATLRRSRTTIEIVEGDAAVADYSEGTVYFLFNPFGPQTLQAVLERIGDDLTRRPRKVRFVYVNPVYRELFDRLKWVKLITNRSFLGSPLTACYYVNAVD